MLIARLAMRIFKTSTLCLREIRNLLMCKFLSFECGNFLLGKILQLLIFYRSKKLEVNIFVNTL
jgi:hypothetical protein